MQFLRHIPDSPGGSVQITGRGYAFLRAAVLVMAHDRTQSVTKELYPTVAKRCGGNPLQVERTIRAAIHSAWDNRDESAWNQVFHTDGPIPRPTNSAIISLLAEQLGNDDLSLIHI